jgi:hypothetical protein
MTDQEVFDYVSTFLLKQGVPSKDLTQKNQPCLYRGPNGTKCAVGCLIPDELYDPVMESMPVVSFGKFPDVYAMLGLGKHSRYSLLAALQLSHDWYFSSTDELKKRLRIVAIDKNLSTVVLDNLHD